MFLIALVLAGGCQQQAGDAGSKSPPPATVDRRQHEEDLNKIELTAEAEQSVGLQTEKVVQHAVVLHRTYGGEVVFPPDAAVMVFAPFAGRVATPAEQTHVGVGSRVQAGEVVLILVPELSPERNVLTPAERTALAQAQMQLAQSRVDAEGQVEQARAQLEAAEITLRRAEGLLRDQAGTAQAVDDARAQQEIARKVLQAAVDRKSLVDAIKLDAEAAGKAVPIPITAPRTGMIRNLHVAAGEILPAGAALFEVVDPGQVWVRVPVYVGEVEQIAIDAPAFVKKLSRRSNDAPKVARPVPAPPTSVPQAAAVDLYFEIDNADESLLPGERVATELSLKSETEKLVIPKSAVLYDIYGSTWIYEKIGPRTYARRRVSIPFFTANLAVLDDGPPVGADVVTVGASELFGTEFEFGK